MSVDSLYCAKPIAKDTVLLQDINPSLLTGNTQYLSFPSTFIKQKAVLDSLASRKKLVASIFKGHQLHTSDISKVQDFHKGENWIAVVLLFAVVLFVWVKSSHSKRMKSISDGFYALRYVVQQTREGSVLTHNGAIELFVVFALSISLIIYHGFEVFGLNNGGNEGFNAYWRISLVVLLTYLLKYVVLKFVGTVFNVQKEMSEYLTQIFILNESQGLILLPMALVLTYIEVVPQSVIMHLVLLIFVAFYVFRIVRGIIIASSGFKFSKFYLFLYFCILEILPSLVVLKLIIRAAKGIS